MRRPRPDLSPLIVVAPSTLPVPESAIAVRNDAAEPRDEPLAAAWDRRGPSGCRSGRWSCSRTSRRCQRRAPSLARCLAWRHPIVATSSDGVLGPPVLIEREGFALVSDAGGDTGLRDLLRADPGLVTAVEHAAMPDVDTAEDLERIAEPCPGCGARYLPQVVDEMHPYIGASPACWSAFGELLAREFGDVAFGRIHRQSVDVYAVQHPGNGRSPPATVGRAPPHRPLPLARARDRIRSAHRDHAAPRERRSLLAVAHAAGPIPDDRRRRSRRK